MVPAQCEFGFPPPPPAPSLGAKKAELCGRSPAWAAGCPSGPSSAFTSQWGDGGFPGLGEGALEGVRGEQNPFDGPLGLVEQPWELGLCAALSWQLLALGSPGSPRGWSKTLVSCVCPRRWWWDTGGLLHPPAVLNGVLAPRAGGLGGLGGLAALQEGSGLAPLPQHLHGLVCHRPHLGSHQCCHHGCLQVRCPEAVRAPGLLLFLLPCCHLPLQEPGRLVLVRDGGCHHLWSFLSSA